MGLVKIEIDTKDITGMINSLKKVISYFEELHEFALSERGAKIACDHIRIKINDLFSEQDEGVENE